MADAMKDRVALITGASRGVGAAVARAFSERGASVGLLSRAGDDLGLPNALHVEWAVRAAQAGKHVLVEKPLASRASEAERAFDAAEAAGVVMSEGFMWRHNPQTARLMALVGEGAVGEVRLVRAAFSFPLVGRDEDVRWDPGLGGGSLLDVGTYCVSGIRLVLGEPAGVSAFSSGTGVDTRFAGAMSFDGGALATFDCGFDLPSRSSLEVIGSDGVLSLADPWHARRPGIELRRGDDAELITTAVEDSYRLELEDVSASIRTGRPPLLGREDAVGQARVLERLLHGSAVPA